MSAPPPAFAPPAPAGSAFLGRAVPAPAASAAARAAPAPVVARFGGFGDADKYSDWAAEIFGNARRAVPRRSPPVYDEAAAAAEARKTVKKAKKAVAAKLVRDFATMRDQGKEDITARAVKVAAVKRLSATGDVCEVVLDVAGTAWDGAHKRPGQFLQVGNGDRRGCFTIASRPEAMDGRLSVLVGVAEDPVGLAKVRPGATVRVGMVLGAGLGVEEMCEGKRLFLFADCLQGFAAVRSLCDWGLFRASSGEGANRRVPVTIFYQMRGSGSMPCSERLGEWSMYGINVVPVVRQSLSDYLRLGGFGTGGFGAAGSDGVAVACVAGVQTAEEVFISLAAAGVRRERFHMYTERRIERELEAYEESEDVGETMRDVGAYGVDFSAGAARPQGMPEDVFDHMHRMHVEDQVWRRWVGIRDAMRKEFERNWVHKRPASRNGRETAQEVADQKQAWASWFAHNKDAWGAQTQWEDVSWGSYWSGWQSEQSKWTKNWGAKTASNPWGPSGSAWSQSRSQEFWDAAYGGAGGGGGGGGGGGSSYDQYSKSYDGSSGSWGSSSTKSDPRGDRYTYEEPAGGPGSSKYSAGRGAGASGGGQRTWQNGSNQRSYTGGGGGGSAYGASRRGFQSTDFYQLLGVDSGASAPEIKKAYRRAAMANHPDLNPEAGSTERMQNVVVAYMTLKDKSKRSHYDKYGV